jgi:hypothetical protein
MNFMLREINGKNGIEGCSQFPDWTLIDFMPSRMNFFEIYQLS